MRKQIYHARRERTGIAVSISRLMGIFSSVLMALDLLNWNKFTFHFTHFRERSSLHHHHEVHDPTHHGFWKKKFAWRPRWVKTWQEKKVYVAVWKRMWGPVEVNEWVPLPKPPPGWIKHDVSSYVVKGHPH